MTLTEFLLAMIEEDRKELASSRYVAEDHWWLPDCAARARLEGENEAKRRIVTNLMRVCEDGRCGECGSETALDVRDAVLLTLALPYSDHAGYRDEWKP